MTALPSLTEKKSSSKSWIWYIVLSVLVLITAVVVWWQIRRLTKKINKLEGEKALLKDQLNELTDRVALEKNQTKAVELQAVIEALQKEIAANEAQLVTMRAEAAAKQAELANAKPW